jgi:hypothetical protein
MRFPALPVGEARLDDGRRNGVAAVGYFRQAENRLHAEGSVNDAVEVKGRASIRVSTRRKSVRHSAESRGSWGKSAFKDHGKPKSSALLRAD